MYRYRRLKNINQKQPEEVQTQTSTSISDKIKDNLQSIKTIFGNTSDLVAREFKLSNSNVVCAIVYVEGLVNVNLINDTVIRNIQIELFNKNEINTDGFQDIIDRVISPSDVKKVSDTNEIVDGMLSGETVLYIDGQQDALIIDTRGWESRSIEEPTSEAVVRGPRDGFTETLRTNTAQLRRKVKNPALRFENYKIGNSSKKDVVVSYIETVAHPDLVTEVKRRIDSVDVEDVEETGIIEQWIEDSFLSPFPQLLHTERVDKAAAALIRGKIIILVDGTPFVLIAPITFSELLQSPEDYYERWLIGTTLRFLRTLCAFFALFLPALYVALVSYHPDLIPTKLAFSIAGSREGVPFPAIIEAIMMEVTLEILREAGIRLPKMIGQTIGIVGGLVIGEAAVAAGIVSPIMVIVVAITAVSSFALPSYSVSIPLRILRFLMMLVAATFGLYGIVLVYIMINIHLANLKSFGIPYTTPFAPNITSDWKDLILRAPVTMLPKRPKYMQTKNDQA